MEVLHSTMYGEVLGTPVVFWFTFLAVVAGLLAFDLGILHRDRHEIGARESLCLYSGYVAIAVLFGAWVWWARGAEAGLQFYTGYVIEQSLAMDNLFVIASIFGFFAVPRGLQHRVLFWGIVGAIVLRAVLIGCGAALVANFSWVLLVFGIFLIATGSQMLRARDQHTDLTKSRLLAWFRRRFRISPDFSGEHFLVRLPHPGGSAVYLTPLAASLIAVEAADLVFAIDSVPAIFAVTQDTFLVYTSNIFAILGLRSLYFALAAAVHRFAYLKYSLAILLVLVGCKVFLVPFDIKVDTALSLAVTIAILVSGIAFSLWKTRRA